MRSSEHKIVTQMREAVPAGLPRLNLRARETLRELTALLLESGGGDADVEYGRYRGIVDRALPVEDVDGPARDTYAARRILVTGGTGCIGTELLRQLRALGPSQVFCLYALTETYDPIPGVVYLHVDIRDEVATRIAIRDAAPDVIFHCAAQRSPWLAEREVERTLATNVLGTRNVLRGARDVELPLFVHASTGKAMRYYTTDVYAASKKLAEWLVSDYAAEGRAAGLARFTHVVDNAVVLDKIDESLDHPDAVMRVHDAEACFYAQSAVESAQLLLLAGSGARPGLRGLAIRELDEPVGLTDLVVGRMRERGRRDTDPVIYFSGYDKGYEKGNPPGLYDPTTAFELSPLINAVEARTAEPLLGLDAVDQFALTLPQHGRESDRLADALADTCRRGDRLALLAELTRDATRQADVTLRQCPDDLFARLDTMARRAGEALPTTRSARAAA